MVSDAPPHDAFLGEKHLGKHFDTAGAAWRFEPQQAQEGAPYNTRKV
jgi:hypothetical protein